MAKIARDITELKVLEEALRQQKDQLKNYAQELSAAHRQATDILESISDAFYAVDHKWRFTYINAKAEKLWKKKRKDLLGKSIWEVFPQAIGSESYKRQIEATKTRKPARYEAFSPVVKGWIEVSVYPSQGGLSVYFQDINERKEMDLRKDEFIAMASHELKTPVTSIKMFSQVFQKRLAKQGDSTLLKYVSTMDKQINKLAEIVSMLLDVSRMQAGKLVYKHSPFAINELIAETVETIQVTSKTHIIKIKRSTSKKVLGDRDRIEQVITNFINNAIKYSPGEESVIVKSVTRGNFVIFSVQDFGVGISKAKQIKIFDRFFQVNPATSSSTYHGLGLGLYIAKEIIEKHKGKVWVESEFGRGSTFFFSLPAK